MRQHSGPQDVYSLGSGYANNTERLKPHQLKWEQAVKGEVSTLLPIHNLYYHVENSKKFSSQKICFVLITPMSDLFASESLFFLFRKHKVSRFLPLTINVVFFLNILAEGKPTRMIRQWGRVSEWVKTSGPRAMSSSFL